MQLSYALSSPLLFSLLVEASPAARADNLEDFVSGVFNSQTDDARSVYSAYGNVIRSLYSEARPTSVITDGRAYTAAVASRLSSQLRTLTSQYPALATGISADDILGYDTDDDNDGDDDRDWDDFNDFTDDDNDDDDDDDRRRSRYSSFISSLTATQRDQSVSSTTGNSATTSGTTSGTTSATAAATGDTSTATSAVSTGTSTSSVATNNGVDQLSPVNGITFMAGLTFVASLLI